MIENPTTPEEEKLVQSPFNTNVAFYVHLKSFNNSVREELERRITEVFFLQEELTGNLIVLVSKKQVQEEQMF